MKRTRNKSAADVGRLDILAARLLGELGKRNPVIGSFYGEFKPELDAMLHQHLGPRNRTSAKLRKFIVDGNRVLSARRMAQLRGGTPA